MARFDQPIEPMTLGNMRELGVRSLFVSCWQCHRQAVLSADDTPVFADAACSEAFPLAEQRPDVRRLAARSRKAGQAMGLLESADGAAMATFARLLARGADEAALYTLAVDTLVALQRAAEPLGAFEIPPYDMERLLGEAALLVDWHRPLDRELREEYLALWQAVLPDAVVSPPTLVLRDYHVDNLMLLPDRPVIKGCGLLDFQDAVTGPPSYDLVSLLGDARRDVPASLRRAMTERYLAAFPALDRTAFPRSAAILAAHRNCKILGIFTRLWKRDGKRQYLAHIPRVWRLLEADLRHPALTPIARWLDRQLPPETRCMPGSLSEA